FGVQDALTNLANGTVGGGDGGNDFITSVSGPEVVSVGSTATLSVGYEASTTRDIVVFFQLDSDPWTVYETVITAVNSGTGTLSIDVPIPATTPVANDAYQFQVLIAPTGGQWNERLSNQELANVDAVIPTSIGPEIPNGTYYIKKASSNAYVNAPGNTNNLNSVQGPSGNSTKWTFTHLGDEEYEITSVAYPGQRMEVPYGNIGQGTLVARTTWGGNANHLVWIAVKVGNNFQFLPKHDPARALDIWENNPNVVHLWGSNTNNANQVFQLIGTSARGGETEASLTGDTNPFTLYPNPAQHTLTIQRSLAAEGTIQVINLTGQVVEETILDLPATSYTMDVSHLPMGLYWVRLGGHTVRFVKE
ncbi:MAG: T9SS type A sorting domain-containing protein, partial [Bacteroidota bacterium]